MIKNPIAVLALLTGLNFINYLDRFILAAVLPRVQADLGLSNFEGGLLATVFLLGYFVTSPLFGILGDRMPRKYLIAAGVFTWSVATVFSGMSNSLATLIIARAFVGIGEASYATLAPTIIDDIAPPNQKGRYLAIFFVAIPIGAASGYLLGGYVQKAWGWREAFFIGGGPGVVLALACLAIDEPKRKLAAAKDATMGAVMRTLSKIKQYRRAVFGYCAHTASIGAFAYWAPKFLSARFGDQFEAPFAAGVQVTVEMIEKRDQAILSSANFYFGIITVVGGALGTVIGGRMADRALRGLPTIPADADETHPANRAAANAQLFVCAVGVAIAFPLAAAAFLAPNYWMFFALAFVAEVGLFMSTAPINAILLRTAPAVMRASAMAVAIFAIHLFGDLWSPSLVGLFLDHLPLALAMMALPFGFAIATIVWWPRKREAS
ncbi:MAG: MFS transporter [Deltaproteobacteria bacterium]|nr:MFS transporter [Deltaproteobacteria bacterium]